MNINKKYILGLIVFLYSHVCAAYGVDTHETLSEVAHDRSVLGDPNQRLLMDLGLVSNISDPQPEFLNQPIDEAAQSTLKSVKALIAFGSINEDNVTFTSDAQTVRVLNHFYDPQNGGRPLSVFGSQAAVANSVDWALEDNDDYEVQLYSYRHALDYFYTALTAQSRDERDRHWGLTFQTLGHVIHHIQDMAQPQHTRNDPHTPYGLINPAGAEEFEKYTDARGENLPVSGYAPLDITVFNTPRSFWDQQLSDDTQQGTGLAEYSSYNFLSFGTNFRGPLDNIQAHPDYPQPDPAQAVPNASVFNIEDELGTASNQPLRGLMRYVGLPVTDAYRPNLSAFNDRATTFSLIATDIRRRGGTRRSYRSSFTLNRFNYDAALELLLPRAVAYSAGLINYFFRGQIDMQPTADGWTISNLSAHEMQGTFTVYYDSRNGDRYPVPDAEWSTQDLLASGILPAGESIDIPLFDISRLNPIRGTSELILVFRGRIGNQAANTQSIDVTAKAVPVRNLYVVGNFLRSVERELFISNVSNPNPNPNFPYYTNYSVITTVIHRYARQYHIADYFDEAPSSHSAGSPYRVIAETPFFEGEVREVAQSVQGGSSGNSSSTVWTTTDFPLEVIKQNNKLYIYRVSGTVSADMFDGPGNPFLSYRPGDLIDINSVEEEGFYFDTFKNIGTQALQIIDLSTLLGDHGPINNRYVDYVNRVGSDYYRQNGIVNRFGVSMPGYNRISMEAYAFANSNRFGLQLITDPEWVCSSRCFFERREGPIESVDYSAAEHTAIADRAFEILRNTIEFLPP